MRFVILRWPPETDRGPEGDPGALAAEVDEVLPGLLWCLTPDDKGHHATSTVDMSVLLEGELWLQLEDGSETRLTPGSCVVLRGNRHAWSNRSGGACSHGQRLRRRERTGPSGRLTPADAPGTVPTGRRLHF